MGPLQNQMQFDRVIELIEDAKQHGKVIAGGDALDQPGYFIRPTIIRDIPEDARIVQEEQFGPVLPVLAYDDIDDVIARANAGDYGLAGIMWGRDVDRALDVASRIHTGTVWVNEHMVDNPTAPLRGAKQSGLGAELGQEGA